MSQKELTGENVFNEQKKILSVLLKIEKRYDIHINIEVDMYSRDIREWLGWFSPDVDYNLSELHKRRSLTKSMRNWESTKGDYSGFLIYEKTLEKLTNIGAPEDTKICKLIIGDLQAVIDGLKLTIK